MSINFVWTCICTYLHLICMKENMFKRFCGFGLSILFASINILPMYYDNRYIKSLTTVRSSEKGKEKAQDTIPRSPSLVPSFKRQSIALSSTNIKNQHTISFYNHDQPYITHYLFNGESIAKSTQINGAINFESGSNTKGYDFSLLIPYQASTLTINSQGKCVFEKPVDTFVAYLQCKSVDFSESFFIRDGLIVEADSFKSKKKLTSADLLFKGENFKVAHKSSLAVQNSLQLLAQNLVRNKGIVECKNLSLVKSFLFENDGTFSSNRLNVDAENIMLEKESSIESENIDFQAHTSIENKGSINVKKHLATCSVYITNTGMIDADTAHIKAHWSWLNKFFGMVSIKNGLTIDSPFTVNLFGLTYAQDLNINSALSLNLCGLYIAKNFGINCFFDLKGGLSMPDLTDPLEIISPKNIFKVAESLFINYVPVYGLLYSALKNVQGVYYQGKNLLSQACSLRQQKQVGKSDIIAFLCLIKNMCSSLRQANSIGTQGYKLVSDYQAGEMQHFPMPSLALPEPESIAKTVASHALSICMPHENRDAIAEIDCGVSLGINKQSNSLLNWNLGFSLYFNNSINTSYGTNVGLLNAYNLNVNATHTYSSDGAVNVVDGAVKADEVSLSDGTIQASGNFQAHGTSFAYVAADISAKKVGITSDKRAMISQKANITSADTYVQAKTIDQGGTIVSQQTLAMNGDNITNNGPTKAPITVIKKLTDTKQPDNVPQYKKNEFRNNSTMEASEQLYVDAHDVQLNEKSSISSPQACFKSQSDWHNKGGMNVAILATDVHNKTINDGSIKASDCWQAKSHEVLLNKKSDVDAKLMLFEVGNNWQNDGQAKGLLCRVKADQKAINNGDIETYRLEVEAQDVLFQKTSKVNTKEASYTAGRILDIDGVMNIEEGEATVAGKTRVIGKMGITKKFDIKTPNIDFEKTADVIAKKLGLKVDEKINNKGNLLLDQCEGHAKCLENSGHIRIRESGHLKIDRYVWNKWFSSIYSDNELVIDVPFSFNTFGFIGAHNLRTNSIIDVNLFGIYGGFNVSQHSFASLNTGILLPYIKSLDLDELITWDNASRVGGYLASQCFPTLAAAYSLLKEINYLLGGKGFFGEEEQENCFFKRIKRAKDSIESLFNKENLCMSDVVPVLCEAKSVCWSAMQLKDQVFQVGSHSFEVLTEICQEPSDIDQETVSVPESQPNGDHVEVLPLNNDQQKSSFTSTVTNYCYGAAHYCYENKIPLIIASAAVSTLGPQLTRDSLLDINSGVMLGANGSSQSLYNANVGASFFGNSYSLKTVTGVNSGFIGGGNVSVSALNSYSSEGGAVYVGNLSASAGNLSMKTDISAFNKVTLSARNNAVIDRKIKAFQATVYANNIVAEKDAHIVVDGAYVKANETIQNSGCIKAKNAYVKAKNIVATETSQVSINGGEIDVSETAHNEGSLKIENTTIKAQNIVATETSDVMLKNTELDIKKVVNAGTVNASDLTAKAASIELQKTSRVNINNSNVDVNKPIQIDVSETIQNDGLLKIENAKVKAQNVVATETSNVVMNNSELDATNLVNAGAFGASNSTITTENVALEESSRVDISDSDVNASGTVYNAGQLALENAKVKTNALEATATSHIAMNNTELDAQSVHGEKGNTIISQNGSVVKTKKINNQGTTKGLFVLQFEGDSSQLQCIGDVERIFYSGTLENNVADKLANGNNDLLHVQKKGLVAIDAENQDVHFKEKHDMSHGLYVNANQSICCDEELHSEKSIYLNAKENIQHDTIRSDEKTALIGKKISSTADIARQYSENNYEDTCEQTVVFGGKQVFIQAEELMYPGTKVESGLGGTKIIVTKKCMLPAIELEKHTETQSDPTKKRCTTTNTTTKDTYITNIPAEFKSQGPIELLVPGECELHDTVFDSPVGTTITTKKLIRVPVYDKHFQEIEKKIQTPFLQDKTEKVVSFSQTEKGLTFNGGKTPIINSDNEVSLAFTCDAPEITINAPEVECKTTKQATRTLKTKAGRYGWSWDRMHCQEINEVATIASYNCTINTNAQHTTIEEAEKFSPPIVNATRDDASINRVLIKDISNQHKESLYNRPTPLAMNIIALSLSLAMSTMAAPLGATIGGLMHMSESMIPMIIAQSTTSSINALCFDAIKHLLHCNGNFKQAVKDFAQTKTVKDVALASLIAATSISAGQCFDKIGIPPVSHAESLWEGLFLAAPREALRSSMQLAADVAQRKNFEEAAKYRLKQMAANCVGAACSNMIGQAYAYEEINFVEHKLLHILTGALEGAIVEGEDGILPGAVGAGVSEFVADIARPKPPSIEDIKNIETQRGRLLTQEEFTQEWNNLSYKYLMQSHSVADASKMIATIVAGVTDQDVMIAQNAAANAIDNNFLILATYGLAGASAGYSAYQVYNAYQENGVEGALDQLGIEVLHNVTGLAFGRATEAVLFKVGGMVYPSAKEALHFVLDAAPGLKKSLGNFIDTLVTASEKFASTQVGKQVTRVSNAVHHLETQFVKAENKLANKIGNRLNKGVEDLVEHVVPTKVLNKVEKQLAKKAAKESVSKAAQPIADISVSLPEKAPVAVIEKVKQELTESQKFLENFAKEFFEGLKTEIEELKNKFSQYEKINDKWLKLDMEHFFGMDVSWGKKGKANLGGFHQDLDNKILNQGIFEFADKVMYDHGFWKAKIFYKGDFVKNGTFFPSDWSREKVVSKIFEAYQNAVNSGIKLVPDDSGKYFLEGFTNEGIEIAMHITQKGHIKTVYPVFK